MKFSLGPYLSLSKFRKSDNTCVVFTYSIKCSREIRKFHVVVVQRWQRNVQSSVMHVQSCCLLLWTFSFCRSPTSPSPSSLVLLSSRNRATMVTWRHTPPHYCDKSTLKLINSRDWLMQSIICYWRIIRVGEGRGGGLIGGGVLLTFFPWKVGGWGAYSRERAFKSVFTVIFYFNSSVAVMLKP